MKKLVKILIATTIFLAISGPVLGLSEADIRITPEEIANLGGTVIPERYAVSPQAYELYNMATQKMLVFLPAPPVKQFFVSAKFSNIMSTVYYYEFRDLQAAKSGLSFIKSYIWGGEKANPMHPERIINLDKYIIVISSEKSNQLDRLLFEKVLYLPIPDQVIARLIERTANSSKDSDNPRLVLKEWAGSTGFPITTSGRYFGRSWDLNEKGKIVQSNIEILEFRQQSDGLYGFWMSLAPENDKEKKQLEAIMEGQKRGEKLQLPSELASFLEESYQKNACKLVVKEGKYYFLEADGNLAQLKRVRDKILLVVATEHWTGEDGGTIIGYFWNKQN